MHHTIHSARSLREVTLQVNEYLLREPGQDGALWKNNYSF